MTTPTIAEDLKTIEDALKVAHDYARFIDGKHGMELAEDAIVALQRIKARLQPTDDGVAVAGADDDDDAEETP